MINPCLYILPTSCLSSVLTLLCPAPCHLLVVVGIPAFGFADHILLMALVLQGFFPRKFSLFFLGKLRLLHGGRFVFTDKVKINFKLLCGLYAILPITLMNDHFIHEFIDYYRGKYREVCVSVYKLDEFTY